MADVKYEAEDNETPYGHVSYVAYVVPTWLGMKDVFVLYRALRWTLTVCSPRNPFPETLSGGSGSDVNGTCRSVGCLNERLHAGFFYNSSGLQCNIMENYCIERWYSVFMFRFVLRVTKRYHRLRIAILAKICIYYIMIRIPIHGSRYGAYRDTCSNLYLSHYIILIHNTTSGRIWKLPVNIVHGIVWARFDARRCPS